MPRRPATHVDDAASVGRRLRTARLDAGLSQRDLAFAGCTAAYISRIEAGARVPSYQLLREFGRRLGVSAEYLATGRDDRLADVMLEDADLATRFGEIDEAARLYEAVLEDAHSTPRQRTAATMGQAEHAFLRGDHQRVLQLLEPLAREITDPDAAAWISDRLGRAYAHHGEYDQSLAVIEQAFERAQQQADQPAILRFAILLANASLDGGNYGRAVQALASALVIAERTGDPVEEARVRWTQSRLHARAGQADLAARYARQAITLLELSEQSSMAASVYQLLAHIENDRGNPSEALTLLEQGEDATTTLGNRYHVALFDLERARSLALLGENEEAAAIAMRVVGLLEEIDPSDSSRAYRLLADVFRQLGQNERALELYELAADRLREHDPYRADIYAALGELLEESGRRDEALAAYKVAAQLRATSPLGR